MSKESVVFASEEVEQAADQTNESRDGLKTYRAPWKGEVVLVCKKCQNKLKHGGHKSRIAGLAKELKKRAKGKDANHPLKVIEVSCLKMCPKGGVTVCTQQQLASGQCSIVWSRADIDVLAGVG